MSDRQRFRRATPQDRFDAIRTTAGHEWLMGGPWDALDPVPVALRAINMLTERGGPERALERWRLVLYAALADRDGANND